MSIEKTNKRLSNRAKIESSHFISDIGVAHVYMTNGCWLPLERLVDEFRTISPFPDVAVVVTFTTDTEALAEAVRIGLQSRQHVYPICGSTLLRLIDAEETA